MNNRGFCLQETRHRTPSGYYLQSVGDKGCLFALDIEDAMTFETADGARAFVATELPKYIDELVPVPQTEKPTNGTWVAVAPMHEDGEMERARNRDNREGGIHFTRDEANP